MSHSCPIFLLSVSLLLLALSSCLSPHDENSPMVWHNREKRQSNKLASKAGNAGTLKVMSTSIDPSNPEAKLVAKTHKDLKTYAVLQNDVRGSLPNQITMCSALLTTNSYLHFPLTLLGRDEKILLKTFVWNIDKF